MPFHPVTAALMYRGIYTIPNILAADPNPVDIPEDELEAFFTILQKETGLLCVVDHLLSSLICKADP
ncbi:hypothetical protein E2320_012539 [Naja naja]|nr:hypothetical protein E2320_012539 [Naja naja]